VDNVDQVFSPGLLVYADRVQANLDRMIEMAGGADKLRPHVKTHKMPAIVELSIASGIIRFKSATISEAEMTTEAGAADVLLAAQPVGPNIGRFVKLVEQYPSCQLSCLVDDPSVVANLESAFQAAGSQGSVWIDIDVGMHRTGIAPSDAATELVCSIRASEHLRLAGIHVYDGHLHDTDSEKLRRQFDEVVKPFWIWFDEIQRASGNRLSLVAGGTPTSAFWQADARARQVKVETGAGTTVLWDAGQPTFSPSMPFEPAAVVLTRVISRPTEFDVCLDLGHKSIASEMPLPRVRWLNFDADHEVVGHNEEHMVLRTKLPCRIRCGDVLYGLPVHVCPTVALHQHAECVRDHRAIEKWPVVARNRMLSI
jgi:D-serine deaminase-like pyridoxal phosphate-dependent protein